MTKTFDSPTPEYRIQTIIEKLDALYPDYSNSWACRMEYFHEDSAPPLRVFWWVSGVKNYATYESAEHEVASLDEALDDTESILENPTVDEWWAGGPAGVEPVEVAGPTVTCVQCGKEIPEDEILEGDICEDCYEEDDS